LTAGLNNYTIETWLDGNAVVPKFVKINANTG
jgi:hypothetical protein